MEYPIFDTHAHYSARAFDADRFALLDSLPGKGVVGVCEQATHSGDAPKVLELAHKYPWVYAAVGIHPESLLAPEDCGEEGPAPTVSVYGGDWAAEMRALAPYYEDPKVVAVGECGLDYHWPVPKDAQLALFEAEIRLALELDKPIIVHDRSAHADVYALLKKYRPKGIVHCYSGSADDAVWLARQGLYFGFGGACTFNTTKWICQLIVPLVTLVEPILPIAMAMTLMIQAFGSFYVGINMCRTNTERGVAGITAGAIATCSNPAYGLFIGVALAIIMEYIGMSKKERRANVEEGIEIYVTNCRAELEEMDAKDAAKAAKKAGRIAAEGMSYALTENGVGVVVEVNCETDFCAKSDLFVAFVKDIAKVIAEQDPADVDALMNCKYVGSDLTVSETMPEKVMSIGENLQIRRFVRFSENTSVGYVHAGGKIGVLVNLAVDGGIDATEIGKNVAMQIAALNPRFWDKSQVTDEVLAEEKKIALALMDTDPKMASKPEAVKEKIVMGKMNKFYEENCLLQMEFVRGDIFQGSVEKYIADAAKKLGGSVKFVDAVRFQTGEGIEKKQEDFAAEVAAQMNMGK